MITSKSNSQPSVIMELLSNTEVQNVLQNSIKQKLAIKQIVVTELTGIMGFMAEYYNLKVYVKLKFHQHFCRNVPRFYQYFVKTWPQKNLQFRAECERNGAIAKEMEVYSNILPNISKYAKTKLFADCYHARKDLLVLEDLSLTYNQISPNALTSMDSIKIILQNLARLHAGSIAWERAEGFSIGDRFKENLFEVLLTQRNNWFTAGVKGIIHLAQKLPQFDQSFVSEKFFYLLIQAEKLVQPSKALRNVFCHRDTSVSNVFLNLDQNSACFVDFGLSTYCPPAIDIHFLLYISSPREMRQRVYQECIEYYFAVLQEEFLNLKIPPEEISWSDFQEDCRRARLTALIISGLCLPVFKISTDLIQELRNEDNERFDYWMNVDRSELLDIAMDRDSLYKEEVYEIISELLEYVKDNEEIFD